MSEHQPLHNDEQPTPHQRNMQRVAVALVVIVVAGLTLQTFTSYANNQQQNNRAFEQALATAEEVPPVNGKPVDDFQRVVNQAQARQAHEQQLAQNAWPDDDALIRSALQKSERDETPGNMVMNKLTQAEGPGETAESIKQRFTLEEERRVLAAMRSPLVIHSAAQDHPAATEPTDALSQQDMLSEIRQARMALQQQMRGDEASPEMTAVPAQHPPHQVTPALSSRELARQMLAQHGAMPPGVVGEVVSSRRQRDPYNAGPQPGEVRVPVATVLSAVMVDDVISDYDGNWRALLTHDVYDVAREHILMPKGTKITGRTVRVSKVNEILQNRMAFGVTWAVLPDGKRIDMRRTATTDVAGVAALQGAVDRHILAQLGGIAAYAVLGLGPSFSTSVGAEAQSSQDVALQEFTSGSRDMGRRFALKYLNVVPTITIRSGTPMRIFIEDELFIRPWGRVDDTDYTL